MARQFSTLLVAGFCFLATQIAVGQPLLDRVLDRVQEELGNLEQPNDEPAPDLSPEEVDAADANEPGYLGVIADDRQDQGRGVRVLDVVANGPAAKGGLSKDDLITAINTRPIRSMDEMARILSAMPAGTNITFNIRRGEANQDVNVTLSARPAPGERRFEKFGRQPEGGPIAAPGSRPKLGVRTVPVTAREQQQYDLPNRDGALVIDVTAGSRAEKAGLRVGDVILAVGDLAVRNPEQLAELIAAAAGRAKMTVTVLQNGEQTQLEVAQGAGPASRITGRPAPTPTSDDDPEIPRLDPAEPAQDGSQLDAIERRLQQLEDRIEQLEQAAEKKT